MTARGIGNRKCHSGPPRPASHRPTRSAGLAGRFTGLVPRSGALARRSRRVIRRSRAPRRVPAEPARGHSTPISRQPAVNGGPNTASRESPVNGAGKRRKEEKGQRCQGNGACPLFHPSALFSRRGLSQADHQIPSCPAVLVNDLGHRRVKSGWPRRSPGPHCHSVAWQTKRLLWPHNRPHLSDRAEWQSRCPASRDRRRRPGPARRHERGGGVVRVEANGLVEITDCPR